MYLVGVFDFGVGVDECLADGVFEAGVFVEVVDRFGGINVGEVFVVVVDGLADSVHGGGVVGAHSVIVLSLCVEGWLMWGLVFGFFFFDPEVGVDAFVARVVDF